MSVAATNYNALLKLIGASGAVVKQGVGSPEGSVIGTIGDYYARTDGGTNSAAPAYLKVTDTGLNTGWVPIAPIITDDLTAQVDGVLSAFALTATGKAFHDPTQQVVMDIYLNGQRQVVGGTEDYTVSESGGAGTGFDTISFTFIPRSADRLIVNYLPL